MKCASLFDGAVAIAQQVEPLGFQVEILIWITNQLIGLGEFQQAEIILEKAFNTALLNDYSRGRSFALIAEVYAEMGQFQQARNICSKLSGGDRSYALMRISKIYLQHNQLDEANGLLWRLDIDHRDCVIKDLARKYAENGNISLAYRLTNKIKHKATQRDLKKEIDRIAKPSEHSNINHSVNSYSDEADRWYGGGGQGYALAAMFYARDGLLEKALEAASHVKNNDVGFTMKEEAIVEVIYGYVQQDNFDRAFDLIKQLSFQHRIDQAHICIAARYYENKQIDKALNLISEIKTADHKDQIYRCFIEIEKKSGRLSLCLRLLQMIDEIWVKVDTLAKIAAYFETTDVVVTAKDERILLGIITSVKTSPDN